MVLLLLPEKPEHDATHYDRKAHRTHSLNDHIDIVHRYSPFGEDSRVTVHHTCALPGLTCAVVFSLLLYNISHNLYVKLCEMRWKRLFSIYFLYNKRCKLNSFEEETKMLLKRINEICTPEDWYYRVNLDKSICFRINRDCSIERISLIDISNNDPVVRHDVQCLCYMENITIDDFELLKVDALLDLARREDEWQEILDERKS